MLIHIKSVVRLKSHEWRNEEKCHENGPPGRRAVRREVSLGDYFLPFLPEPEVAGAVAAGSWVLGWMASMTGVAMKTEA